ncbi:hypothetical protein LTR86_007382 [Recurvomyces mirabilis]|nr:hypothetical protein LTR86_007382 [Recurvomyces mirabilis]
MLVFLRTLLAYLRTIPATILAKRTIFWKLFHISRGTYEAALRNLHAVHGGVIQVGPREYSIGNSVHFDRCAQLEQIKPSLADSDSTVSEKIAGLVAQALSTANIFSYERAIERCNAKLVDSLNHYAANGETVKLSDLLTSYVFDIMFVTTTGQPAGYLDQPTDTAKLMTAMRTWKFYSVLHGTYFRFYPFIDEVAKMALRPKEAFSLVLERIPDVKDATGGVIAHVRDHIDAEDEDDIRQLLITTAVLITSASDPLITHLLTTLYHVYRTPEVLQALRDEIVAARIYQPPRLRYILKKKDDLPLLHAVLKETLRLHPICTADFIAPEGGVMIGDNLVPADFGAGTHNHQHEDIHYALVVKLLIQILPNINLDMATTMLPYSVMPTIGDIREHLVIKVNLPKTSNIRPPTTPLRATAQAFAPDTTTGPELPPSLTFSNAAKYISSLTLGKIFTPFQVAELAASVTPGSQSPTLSTASTTASKSGVSTEDRAELARLLGDNATRRLLENFDPGQPLTARPAVRTWIMRHKPSRAQAHELIERMWVGRLDHKTDPKTNRMWIQLKQGTAAIDSPLPRNTKLIDKAVSSTSRPQSTTHSVWSAFASDESAKRAAAKAEGDAVVADPERYAAQRKKFADVFAEKQDAHKEAPGTNFTTVFKQTSFKETTDGKLGGPRKLINKVVESDGNDETASAADSTDASLTDDAGGIALPAKAKPAFIPPHLRERAIAAETATTSTSSTPDVEPAHSVTPPTTSERTPSPAANTRSALLYVPPQIRGRSTIKHDSPAASPAHSPSETAHSPPPMVFKQHGSPSPATLPSKCPARSATPPHLRKRSVSPPQVAEVVEWVAARLPMPFA